MGRCFLPFLLVLFSCIWLHAGKSEDFIVPLNPGPADQAPAGTEASEELTAEDIPLAVAKARVGDWARYKTADGGSYRLTVIESWEDISGDRQLVVRMERRSPGSKKRDVQIGEEQVSVKERTADVRDLGEGDYLGRAEVWVKGRKIEAVVVNYCQKGVVTRQSFLSEAVPVYGIVRGVLLEGRTRTVALSLEDFGFGDAK